MPGERRESANKRLGETLRTLRERLDLPQAELARQMSERGWPWHTSTVYRVETGRQTVSLTEAADLAAILRTSLDRLTWPSGEAADAEEVYAAGSMLRQRYEAVAAAVHELLVWLYHADMIVSGREGSESAIVQEAVRETRIRMRTWGLDQAIAEGVSRSGGDYPEEGSDDGQAGADPEGQPRVDDQRDP